MKQCNYYKSKFVSSIPEHLDQGILYICIPYNISAHLCACGCKSEVFTPISRQHGWVLTYDGDNASLSPSIGNGAYPCHSHYFLRNGIIEWLPPIYSDTQNLTSKKKKNWIREFVKKYFNL